MEPREAARRAVKIHLGSGSVYLREWVNVDLPLPNVFLAKERHDLVERFITTEDKYYARHDNKSKDTWRQGPLKQETVCDVYGRFEFLPARANAVSEILARQCFEHLTREQAVQGLVESRRVLQPGGIIRIDIPDPDETMRHYLESGDEFYIRHLFGPRLDTYGFHTHYTRTMLSNLLESHGFEFIQEEPNIHNYPAFCLAFSKQ